MGPRNPFYNPNWEIIHDRHAAERDRLQKAVAKTVAQSDLANPQSREQYDALQRKFAFHSEACRKAFLMQHPTIEGYAE